MNPARERSTAEYHTRAAPSGWDFACACTLGTVCCCSFLWAAIGKRFAWRMHPRRFPFGRAPFSEAAAAASEVRQGIILEGHVGAARAALIPSEIYVCRSGKARERCEPCELGHELSAVRHYIVRSRGNGHHEVILRDDASWSGPPTAAEVCSLGGRSTELAVTEVSVPTPVVECLKAETLNGTAAQMHAAAQNCCVSSEVSAADAGQAAGSASVPCAISAPALTAAADIVPDAQQGDAVASTVAVVAYKFRVLRCRPVAGTRPTATPASPVEPRIVHAPSGPGGGAQESSEARHLRALECAPLASAMPPLSQGLVEASPAASEPRCLPAGGSSAAHHPGPRGFLSHSPPLAPSTASRRSQLAESTEHSCLRHAEPHASTSAHTAAVLLRPSSPSPHARAQALALLGSMPALPAPSEQSSTLRSALRAELVGPPPPASIRCAGLHLQPPQSRRTAGTPEFAPTGPCALITDAASTDCRTAASDTTHRSRPSLSCREPAPLDVDVGCVEAGPLVGHGWQHVPHVAPHRALAGEEHAALRYAQPSMHGPAAASLRCASEALPPGPRSSCASRHRPQSTKLESRVCALEVQPSALPSAPLRCSSAYLLQPGSGSSARAQLASRASETGVVDTLFECRGEQAVRDASAARCQAVEAPHMHPPASVASQEACSKLQDAYGQLHALLAILQQHAEPTRHT